MKQQPLYDAHGVCGFGIQKGRSGEGSPSAPLSAGTSTQWPARLEVTRETGTGGSTSKMASWLPWSALGLQSWRMGSTGLGSCHAVSLTLHYGIARLLSRWLKTPRENVPSEPSGSCSLRIARHPLGGTAWVGAATHSLRVKGRRPGSHLSMEDALKSLQPCFKTSTPHHFKCLHENEKPNEWIDVNYLNINRWPIIYGLFLTQAAFQESGYHLTFCFKDYFQCF